MPTTSPFFTTTTGYQGEQQLVDSLVIEQISMFGIDLMYMPRENINLDKLLHESTKDAFNTALSIPMYIKSFDGYDNSMEMLSKFGVRSSDELTLIMSRSQWSTYYAPYVKSMNNADSGRNDLDNNNPLDGQTSRRPKEGDLVFFPYDNGIFEIKYVQFDQPFFQLGKGYIYELQCEKFEYSGEDFNTGITQIDVIESKAEFYSLEFDMTSGGYGTFEFNERVTIYDLSAGTFSVPVITEDGESTIVTAPELATLMTAEGGQGTDLLDLATQNGEEILTEDNKFIDANNIDFFRLYNDSGFLHQVKSVEGTVMSWDKPNGKLTLGDLTNLDPNQENDQYNPTINKFDSVVIIGNTSKARWSSTKAVESEKAFDDSKIIQAEFDAIHVVDTADKDPFGFL